MDRIIKFQDFQEISNKNDLVKLKNILDKQPRRFLTVRNAISLAISTNFGPTIYTFNGQIEDNSFILAGDIMNIKTNEIGFVVLPPLDLTEEMGKIFIENLLKLNLNKTCLFAIEQRFSYLIENYNELKKGPLKKVPNFEFSLKNSTLTATTDSSIMQNCQTGTEQPTIKSMKSEDSKFILENWKYINDDGKTEAYIKKCIQNFPCCAVYYENEIASCVTIYSIGYAGMLNTNQKFRGKGLACLAMKNLEKKMLENDLIPSCGVEIVNNPSIKVMEKIGWEKTGQFDSFYIFI